MFRKSLHIAGILLALFSAGHLSAQPVRRQPYYRPRSAAQVKPRQPGQPAVVNAASFLPGVSPGSLATIFGQDLSNVADVVVANSNPLPTQLGGVTVLVNGIAAGIYSVAFANGEDQISFQVPWETNIGPDAARIDILDDGFHVASVSTDSFTEDPGIFTDNGFALAVNWRTGDLIGPDNPAAPGDIIILFTTGNGPVSLNIADRWAAPLDSLAYTVDPFQAMIAGEQIEVLFSGLAPGFVGLYQLNLRLPRDLPPGNLDLQITSPFANSGVVKLPVF
jgi:uncharacterized protein (TIGR03437 family)